MKPAKFKYNSRQMHITKIATYLGVLVCIINIVMELNNCIWRYAIYKLLFIWNTFNFNVHFNGIFSRH